MVMGQRNELVNPDQHFCSPLSTYLSGERLARRTHENGLDGHCVQFGGREPADVARDVIRGGKVVAVDFKINVQMKENYLYPALKS